MHLQHIYRLSDNGYPKTKFEFATKEYCIDNFLRHFKINDIHMLVDITNLKSETRSFVQCIHDHFGFANLEFYQGGSSAGSWKYAVEYAINTLQDDDYCYFVEDDYLHKKGSEIILQEGLEISDMVSLYDHKDKYIPATDGGNMFIDSDGGEITKVILSKSTHWKMTNSTTMTFACQLKTLKEDLPIWKKWTMESTHPHDFQAFLEILKHRSLITPIPGYSTHCEPAWASPLINWELV